MKIVLKIGGNEIDDSSFLQELEDLVAQARAAGHVMVLVHGGGKEITGLLEKLGLDIKFVSGMRYTDSPTLDAVEMVLSGLINKRLVKALLRKGIDCIGLSGVDGRILIAERILRDGNDIGLVGKVVDVNLSVLTAMVEKFAVVLSPLAVDAASTTSLNVNADYAAAAVSSALRSDLIIFLSNVPGVLKNGTVIHRIDELEFIDLRKTGVVSGGMVPKIEAALAALKGGTTRAIVTDNKGAINVISGLPGGTQIVA